MKPSDEFNGFIKGSYATYDAAEIEAAIGGRLVENLSARAAIIHQTRDNYVSNGFTNENNVYEGYETTAGRLQFLYTPYDLSLIHI